MKIERKPILNQNRSRLLIAAACLIALLAVFSLSAWAAPAKYGTGRECRSQVFDLVLPEDIPSDGRIGCPTDGDPKLAPRKTAEPETETFIPLVMIVVSPKDQPYSTSYDWYSRIFGDGDTLCRYYSDMSFGKFTFVPVRETSAAGVNGNTNEPDRVDDGIIHVSLATAKQKGWGISDTDRAAYLENMNLLAEALELAGEYMDFAEYDSNGDGAIQNTELAVGFVVAGRDAAIHFISSTNKLAMYYIWPYAYSFSECRASWARSSSGFPEVPVIDGVAVDGFIIIPETYESDGRYDSSGKNLIQEEYTVLAHELGHYLGLPDLYNTGNGSGSWCEYDSTYLSLMNVGCYGEDPNGKRVPYSLDMWSRVQLGWVTPETLEPGAGSVSIAGSMDDSGQAPIALRVNTPRSEEYYLIENRRFTGWDAGMGRFYSAAASSGGGLVLWHIDDEILDARMPSNLTVSGVCRPGVMPLFWEKNGTVTDVIGTSVDIWQPFFDKNRWGTELAFPLYDAKDLSGDTPADRQRSGLVLELESGSAPVMTVSLEDLTGILNPPGSGTGTEEPEPVNENVPVFNAYKEDLTAGLSQLGKEDDSTACERLITLAGLEIAATTYDESRSLEENKAVVDAICAQLAEDLEEQRRLEDEAYLSFAACEKDETCPVTVFADTQKDGWYHDGVHWALDNMVMNGTAGDRFAPNAVTSRAMLVTVLWRLEGKPDAAAPAGFRDVPAGQWYSEAIAWAQENKLVRGYSADRFGPGDRLTREQLAAILYRYAQYKGDGAGEAADLSGYRDGADVSEWALESLRWAVGSGIIQGVGDNVLSPKTGATRAQTATMLMRYHTRDLLEE